MKEQIMKILSQYIVTEKGTCYCNAEIEDLADEIMKIAEFEELCKPDYAEMHMYDAVWEQNLREELIKYEIFCDSLIPFSHKSKDEKMAMNDLVDEYLKQRKP